MKTTTFATNALKDARAMADEIQTEFKVQRNIALSKAFKILEKMYSVPLHELDSLASRSIHHFKKLSTVQISKKFGDISPKIINKAFMTFGLQYKDGQYWRLTEAGKAFGEEKFYPCLGANTCKKRNVYRILWNDKAITLLRRGEL